MVFHLLFSHDLSYVFSERMIAISSGQQVMTMTVSIPARKEEPKPNHRCWIFQAIRAIQCDTGLGGTECSLGQWAGIESTNSITTLAPWLSRMRLRFTMWGLHIFVWPFSGQSTKGYFTTESSMIMTVLGFSTKSRISESRTQFWDWASKNMTVILRFDRLRDECPFSKPDSRVTVDLKAHRYSTSRWAAVLLSTIEQQQTYCMQSRLILFEWIGGIACVMEVLYRYCQKQGIVYIVRHRSRFPQSSWFSFMTYHSIALRFSSFLSSLAVHSRTYSSTGINSKLHLISPRCRNWIVVKISSWDHLKTPKIR